MSYPRYLAYDIFGGFLWVWSMVLLGHTLGRTIPNIDKKIHYVIAGVIVASLIPAAISALRARSVAKSAPASLPQPDEKV
jgi:membrane-associated protein